MKSVNVMFSSANYIRVHGKAPRGTGSWLFEIEGEIYEAPCCLTLTAAKAACRSEILRRKPDGFCGMVWVDILP